MRFPAWRVRIANRRAIRYSSLAYLLNLNAQPGAIEPDNLAGTAFPVGNGKLEYRRNAVSGLHLQAGPGSGNAAYGAGHAPAAEKNLPRLEHPHAGACAAFFHSGACVQG